MKNLQPRKHRNVKHINYRSMTRKYFNIIRGILTLIFFYNSQAQAQPLKDAAKETVFQEIHKSHIDANIPDKNQFDSLLKRDLEVYFSPVYGQVTVNWEFLREGPTQTGVAYPKYYLWVKISKAEKLLDEGAVRMAAIEKTEFEIINYVSIAEIKNKSRDIYLIFPRPVCEKIESRLEEN